MPNARPAARSVSRFLACAGLTLCTLSAAAQSVNVVLEAEPNDTRGKAQRIEVADLVTVVAGNIGKKTDVDLYRLDLPIGGCVAAVLTANPLVDYDLWLLSSLGLVLAKSENRGFAQIETLASCGLPLSQTYYLKAVRHSGPTGPLKGAYSIEIAPVQP